MRKQVKCPSIVKIGDYLYEYFKPTVLNPYKVWFQSMYHKRYIRLVVQALRGSVVFYMKDIKGNIVGYIHLEKGNSRYPWATKNDWIISPYAIDVKYRGKGLGFKLIKGFKEIFSRYFSGNVYAEVSVDNIPSIRVLEKNGFKFIGYAKITGGGMRKYLLVSGPSDYRVYKMK